MDTWNTAQEWERDWWGDCLNVYGEEMKQLLYANRMGLRTFHDGRSPFNFDLCGVDILDIGGGPTSILLKCVNRGRCKVIDPLVVPDWVVARYGLAEIELEQVQAEQMTEAGWDEAWIYNVLQHTRNPAVVIRRAQQAAKTIRLFEWIDTPTNEGHPHALSEALLNKCLGGEGKVEVLNGQNTCKGKCYYGIFPTNSINHKP